MQLLACSYWGYNIINSKISVGTANNAGAILVLGRDLVVVPKLIHPLPPAISSPETSPERQIEDTWMQVHYFNNYAGNMSLKAYASSLIISPSGIRS